MGNECPNGPCKELMQLPAELQTLFTDFIEVEPGFSYDVDGYTRFFEGMSWERTGWDRNNNGHHWDDWKLEANYETPLNTWKAQVDDHKRYITTERERIAAERFSTYAMTVKLGKEFDAGLCLQSSFNGAVCLMRSRNEIDTYRLDNEEWYNV